MALRSIEDADVKGRVVLFRAGLDLPMDREKRIVVTRRLTIHSEAIKKLAERGARVVVLAHQGRRGQENFLHLDQHAAEMSKIIGKDVKFIGWEADLEKEIVEMHPGDVVLLDNVRMLDDEQIEGADAEMYAKTEFVQRLSKTADLYVNNALSVSHRAQASVVGFPAVMPSYAGPTLAAELKALDTAKKCKPQRTLIIGGGKLKDAVHIMETMLEKELVEAVLLGGLMGELFLKATGVSLGAKEHFLKSTDFFDFVKHAKALLANHSKKIVLPEDFGCAGQEGREEVLVKDLPTPLRTLDIGTKTAMNYGNIIGNSRSVIWEGPLGVYEERDFLLGTAKVAQAVTFSDAYSVLAGGDTEAAMRKAGIALEKFSHVSLAGKAAMLYLTGERLPGLEVLE